MFQNFRVGEWVKKLQKVILPKLAIFKIASFFFFKKVLVYLSVGTDRYMYRYRSHKCDLFRQTLYHFLREEGTFLRKMYSFYFWEGTRNPMSTDSSQAWIARKLEVQLYPKVMLFHSCLCGTLVLPSKLATTRDIILTGGCLAIVNQ